MIPKVEFFKSSKLRHDINSHFNPPGLTNFLGVAQVDNDLTGVRGLNFPPFGTSLSRTCGFYLDGVYFPSKNIPISFQWMPDRIIREVEVEGILFRTDTMLLDSENVLLIRFKSKNISGVKKEKKIKFQLNGGITNNLKDWANWIPPMSENNSQDFDLSRNAIIFSDKNSNAILLQSISGEIDKIDRFGIQKTLRLDPGVEDEFYFFAIAADNVSKTQMLHDKLVHKKNDLLSNNRRYWNDEIKSVFQKENSNYSGSLPVLKTENKSLEKLYYMGIMGVIYFKRDSPISCIGRSYDTLMPRYWQTVTFMWDYYLSGTVHALLDPLVMRKYLETWMKMDMHTCFGLEYISGKPVGNWYSINDHAMVMMIKEYLRWTGDFQWLQTKPDGEKSVSEYFEGYVNNYKNFMSKNGLADYGGINNLLECVSSYVHEVASLNAANIANLRYAADLYAFLGHENKSKIFLKSYPSILKNLKDLYVEGKGFWRARQPNGSLLDVRHAYDFFTVINTIGSLLDKQHKEEMVSFFVNELKTDKWMRALSESDNDAMFSLRPDHQWNGAYPAWPSQSLIALINCGKKDLAIQWLDGLAESANQGPFGQAHFSETIMKMDSDGARKSSAEEPWICDWTCSSNGNWVDAVINGFAGIKTNLEGEITAEPKIDGLELFGINYYGKEYDLTKKGLKRKN
tara:strand:+ start:3188 stop:5236 length:2049 start_codon:yes stop_codon:yes gene_type:complete